MTHPKLTPSERFQIAEILKRRANDIASFHDSVGITREKVPGSVEMAMTREITRLRALADKVNPPTPEPEEA